ncbi:hypothetical protein [Flagellimonas lutaonensis]|uniref:Uncharacterized protein n=1 Tax=Flagellimonas lutaonensis TaxID=516051 RepID=A0A0D5YU50_9FLAO|nr:hypothetical protein [Allomuricauda lutaonensis]AKA35857.1 hypothetical protein VC82_2266 [Allomuricauda lutaonensis]
MKRLIFLLTIVVVMSFSMSVNAQIDAGSVMGMPTGTTAEINAITTANIGSTAFNTDDESIYWYTSSGWVKAMDDQFDDEVQLRTAIDVDEGGESSPTSEATVKEVIDAIAPITSKAARVFYPPSIAIDASTNGTGRTVNLYTEYVNQFASINTVASTGAPAAVPTYAANELYYYVTYYDPTVFDNISIDANGVMTYDIIGQPADYNSLINVVFVVK